jgi:hypothetical protein
MKLKICQAFSLHIRSESINHIILTFEALYNYSSEKPSIYEHFVSLHRLSGCSAAVIMYLNANYEVLLNTICCEFFYIAIGHLKGGTVKPEDVAVTRTRLNKYISVTTNMWRKNG